MKHEISRCACLILEINRRVCLILEVNRRACLIHSIDGKNDTSLCVLEENILRLRGIK